MPFKRRPALTALAVKGLPRIMHQGSMSLPISRELDTPADREQRAAVEYLQHLYYWYQETTMNFNYGIRRGKDMARRQRAMAALKPGTVPSPYGP